jgi:hypothetical protein
MEYARQPATRSLERMERTAQEIAAALDGHGDTGLSRRPAPTAWSAKEVICHLRDMLAMEEPKFLVLGEMPHDRAAWGIVEGDAMPLDPDRWADERQYHRNDAVTALAALRRRRQESLTFLARLEPDQWRRGSIHATLGRMTFADWVALIAAHDDKHVAQLELALEGRP